MKYMYTKFEVTHAKQTGLVVKFQKLCQCGSVLAMARYTPTTMTGGGANYNCMRRGLSFCIQNSLVRPKRLTMIIITSLVWLTKPQPCNYIFTNIGKSMQCLRTAKSELSRWVGGGRQKLYSWARSSTSLPVLPQLAAREHCGNCKGRVHMERDVTSMAWALFRVIRISIIWPYILACKRRLQTMSPPSANYWNSILPELHVKLKNCRTAHSFVRFFIPRFTCSYRPSMFWQTLFIWYQSLLKFDIFYDEIMFKWKRLAIAAFFLEGGGADWNNPKKNKFWQHGVQSMIKAREKRTQPWTRLLVFF